MQIDIQFRPSYSLAIVQLAPNEKIRADSGAMVSHSAGVQVEDQSRGRFPQITGTRHAGRRILLPELLAGRPAGRRGNPGPRPAR